MRTVLTGLFGTVTVDGAQWQRMVLRPRLISGRFDAALDVELFIDERGGFRRRGWDFGNATEGFGSILRKIHYIQYGRLEHPEDRVYVRVGALENVTLGFGLIMSDYRNTLKEPGIKKTGLDIAVRNLSLWNVGVRAVVNDVLGLARGGGVYGLRTSIRPVIHPDEMGEGRLEVGLTFVSDGNQYEGLRGLPSPPLPRRDGLGMMGADASYPVWLRDHLQMTLYGQYARMLDRKGIQGEGFGAPGLQLRLGPLKAQAEYRRFSHQFLPQYFDDLYEISRARYDESRQAFIPKTATLRDTAMSGIYGNASLTLGPLLTASASYQTLSGAGAASNQRFLARAALAPPFLKHIPYLGQAVAYYEKHDIDTRRAGFFKSTADTFYGYVVGIDIARDVIVVWDARYTFGPGPSGGLKRSKVLNIQAMTHF